MNPTEIFEALEKISSEPFDPLEFPFAFAEATDVAQAAIAKLRNGTTNKSDQPSGVLVNKKFHYAPALDGMADITLEALRSSKKTNTAKPAVLIATDGEMVAAEQRISGETLHCRFDEIGDNFGFFLPAAGKERYDAVQENPVDVKATGKLARLYDALAKANPEWASDERRHEMNQLMMRLIFCMFAEDVGIFPDNQFSQILFSHSGNKGEEAREVIIAAFTAMNRPRGKRGDLPGWAGDLEYVNGGLFAGAIDAPKFDAPSYRYLRDACDLDWREINPDIFGSMIQSVADPKQRSELGMHYTSVPNIMKVIGPLFLDDLDAEIEKAWERPNALKRLLTRLEGIRVFDPACGSGNFLVVSYRQLREREMRILKRLEELTGEGSKQMFSAVQIANFHGIEITDFGAETAKLALFIAEYQANAVFREVFGQGPASLPLRDSAHIVCENALRVDWENVCPPPCDGEEVFIAGNPPFYGAKKRKPWQTEDMVRNGLENLLLLDYVSTWFFKAAKFAAGQCNFAFVTTSSICQGEQVVPMWSKMFEAPCRIRFAYRPFMWRNSAADNAGVWVTIVGLVSGQPKVAVLYDDKVLSTAGEVSPYLLPGRFIPVAASSNRLFPVPEMVMGSNPVDGKRLGLSVLEKEDMIQSDPRAEEFILPYLGGDELISDSSRFCLWIDDARLEEALSVEGIRSRVNQCAKYRAGAGRDARKVADIPHRFCYSTYQNAPALAVPNSQSSSREFIPAVMLSAGTVLSKEAFAVYDPPDYLLSVVSSSLHRLWLASLGGRIGNGFRYSVRVVYNTFPVPNFSDEQLEALTASARKILKTRYSHYPATIAELYDRDKMPDDLRTVHRENDELLETMYIGRPFRNDTERLEHLFKLYAAKIKQVEKDAAKSKRGKKGK
ncbi:MAG: class I SAM-dependent DNA methyltransferase [Thalassovita sp.]